MQIQEKQIHKRFIESVLCFEKNIKDIRKKEKDRPPQEIGTSINSAELVTIAEQIQEELRGYNGTDAARHYIQIILGLSTSISQDNPFFHSSFFLVDFMLVVQYELSFERLNNVIDLMGQFVDVLKHEDVCFDKKELAFFYTRFSQVVNGGRARSENTTLFSPQDNDTWFASLLVGHAKNAKDILQTEYFYIVDDIIKIISRLLKQIPKTDFLFPYIEFFRRFMYTAECELSICKLKAVAVTMDNFVYYIEHIKADLTKGKPALL